jgi:hypothetical protein
VSLTLSSDYYIVFMNPSKHKQEWNALKYCVFIDFKIYSLELHAVDKLEFETYKYNPN